MIQGTVSRRPHPIGFQSRKQSTLSDNRWKLVSNNNGKTLELYDLLEDRAETHDLAQRYPEIVKRMSAALRDWQTSCKNSDAGKDY